MDSTHSLQSGKITLAVFLPSQVGSEYIAWVNDPETMAFTEARFTGHTEESTKAYVATSNADDHARLFRILHDGTHVGNLRISSINWHHGRAELALVIGMRNLHGHGIGSTAINIAADFCFTTLGLRKLVAGIYAGNVPSIRAFEKAGFAIEATLKDHYLYQGRAMDGILMVRFAPHTGA